MFFLILHLLRSPYIVHVLQSICEFIDRKVFVQTLESRRKDNFK